MKKITLIAIAFVAVSLASCKKDYTCTCTTTGSATPNITKIIGVKKSAAKANCVSTTKTNTTAGASSTPEVETCTLSN
jgi:hypothetical protein